MDSVENIIKKANDIKEYCEWHKEHHHCRGNDRFSCPFNIYENGAWGCKLNKIPENYGNLSEIGPRNDPAPDYEDNYD